MKPAKILILFTFLLAFEFQVSAQDKTPKIVWKNLQEKYESFYDIKPSIFNDDLKPIYLYSPYYSVALYRFDEKYGWINSQVNRCGTGLKLMINKLKPQNEFLVSFSKETWDEMTIADSVMSKFKKFPHYNGSGRYKLRLYYGVDKSDLYLQKFSPEFEVTEKDFKK